MDINEFVLSDRAGRRSRLLAFDADILELRKRGVSLQGVANYLELKGVRISKQGVGDYLKRLSKHQEEGNLSTCSATRSVKSSDALFASSGRIAPSIAHAEDAPFESHGRHGAPDPLIEAAAVKALEKTAIFERPSDAHRPYDHYHSSDNAVSGERGAYRGSHPARHSIRYDPRDPVNMAFRLAFEEKVRSGEYKTGQMTDPKDRGSDEQ